MRRHSSHDWSTAADGYKIFRTDRLGSGYGIAIYVKELLTCTELCLGTSDLTAQIKLQRAVNMLQGQPGEAAGELSDKNLTKFTKGKQALHLGQNNPVTV